MTQEKRFLKRWNNPEDPLHQKTAPHLPTIFCFLIMATQLYFLRDQEREVPSSPFEESIWLWIGLCFAMMGGCVKKQHNRIRKLETALAASEEKTPE